MKRQGRKFIFISLSEAEAFRRETGYLKTFTIRENGNRKVGFWHNRFKTFHTFDQYEIAKVQAWRDFRNERRNEFVELLVRS